MRSRWLRFKEAPDRSEWRRIAGMAAVVVALHVVGFFVLLVLVVPQGLSLGRGGAFGVGIGLTAYTLGLRHAFDADHIAAIDNTTRKLMGEGKRPLATGFFFSLGHSTIVFALALLFTLGLRSLGGQVRNEGSTLQATAGFLGTTVSGSFLLLIGLVNLVALVGILGVVRRMRAGAMGESALRRSLEQRGVMNRVYGRFTRAVRSSWQLYPLGALFGLGFDTATEVALLFLAAGAAFGGLPFYAILCLPVLFAAGMCLLDSANGILMKHAYGWAFARPVRRVYFNLTVTGISVAVALAVGAIELTSVLAERLNLNGFVWESVGGIDLNAIGYFVVALVLLAWAGALLIWRVRNVEERWTASLREPRQGQRAE